MVTTIKQIISGLNRSPKKGSYIAAFLALITLFQWMGLLLGLYEALSQNDPKRLFFVLIDVLNFFGILPSIQSIIWPTLTAFLLALAIKFGFKS